MSSNQRFKQGDEDGEQQSNALDYETGEMKEAVDEATALLRQAHKLEQEEDEREGKPKKKRPSREICFCGDPSCGIGPFTATQGGEEEA